MHFFKVLPFLFVTAFSYCNDAKPAGDVPLSQICSNAKLSEGWIWVECKVGSRSKKFGLDLNHCLANDDNHISIRADGGAMGSCGDDDCDVTVSEHRGASIKCHADQCSGELDLDKAINFSGRYLKCGEMLGPLGEDVDKRALRRRLNEEYKLMKREL
ncbi:hypothetical protein NUU61_000974 [Penicillium alfredii]|uniref:Cyanovirin-N domain-containing protein n=1 Tax=Penicillium alfredii TaxID=1506179 RepID=A0A9W9KR73_9EURO|nr:uncharacterized protein NUU61_000974 [Penicillium alfredii]KAJ5115215.1 hypothetical protein NUU61_000974 [Penicillium alfredii]